MRIWDLPPAKLCRAHLLGEHRELHAIWSILTQNKKGYSLHPETLRWKGKLKALYIRHEELVKEMNLRGFTHKSPLNYKFAIGKSKQDIFVDSINKQKKNLQNKHCKCQF